MDERQEKIAGDPNAPAAGQAGLSSGGRRESPEDSAPRSTDFRPSPQFEHRSAETDVAEEAVDEANAQMDSSRVPLHPSDPDREVDASS